MSMFVGYITTVFRWLLLVDEMITINWDSCAQPGFMEQAEQTHEYPHVFRIYPRQYLAEICWNNAYWDDSHHSSDVTVRSPYFVINFIQIISNDV